MRLKPKVVEERVAQMLTARGIAEADDIGWACAWLEACGYPGLKLLEEALADRLRHPAPARDAMGIDLQNISCVWLAPGLVRDVRRHGRVFLRNVRHGLYLLPFTVREGLGIGCPVDPAFAIGGERTKNPYGERLAAAETNGIEVEEMLFSALPPSRGKVARSAG